MISGAIPVVRDLWAVFEVWKTRNRWGKVGGRTTAAETAGEI